MRVSLSNCVIVIYFYFLYFFTDRFCLMATDRSLLFCRLQKQKSNTHVTGFRCKQFTSASYTKCAQPIKTTVKLARLCATVIVAVIGSTTPALTYQTQELSCRWQKQIQTTFCSFN